MLEVLTDVEICKKIGVIEKCNGDFGVNKATGHYGRRYIDGSFSPYNPLTDDALCFRLMVKYEVAFCQVFYLNSDKDDLYTATISPCDGVYSGTPNKAICLAIIEAHKSC